jgi:hypothetical protein
MTNDIIKQKLEEKGHSNPEKGVTKIDEFAFGPDIPKEWISVGTDYINHWIDVLQNLMRGRDDFDYVGSDEWDEVMDDVKTVGPRFIGQLRTALSKIKRGQGVANELRQFNSWASDISSRMEADFDEQLFHFVKSSGYKGNWQDVNNWIWT